MTILLDIAALLALLLALTFVPVLGLRHEARITRQLRAAEARRAREEAEPASRSVPARLPGHVPQGRRQPPAPRTASPAAGTDTPATRSTPQHLGVVR
jgi:hypothetical protein